MRCYRCTNVQSMGPAWVCTRFQSGNTFSSDNLHPRCLSLLADGAEFWTLLLKGIQQVETVMLEPVRSTIYFPQVSHDASLGWTVGSFPPGRFYSAPLWLWCGSVSYPQLRTVCCSVQCSHYTGRCSSFRQVSCESQIEWCRVHWVYGSKRHQSLPLALRLGL